MAKKTTAAATATPAAVAAETPAAADPQGHEHDDGLEDGFAAPAMPGESDGATERRSDEGGSDGGGGQGEGGGIVAAADAVLVVPAVAVPAAEVASATLALTPRQQAAQSLADATARVKEIGDPLKWRNELNADFEGLIKEREAFLKDWQDRQNALQVQRQERFNRCQDLLEEKRLLELEIVRLQKVINAPEPLA